jgi:hypothetical protein
MLKGEARPARIPFPKKSAGFKKPAEYYHRGRRGPPENLPAGLRRLRGRDRTWELRRELRAEANLKRDPRRWVLVFGVWGLLILVSALFLLNATTGKALPFVFLVGAIAWFAAFSTNPTTRLLCGVLLFQAALFCVFARIDILAGVLIGLAAVWFVAGAIPQIREEMALLKRLERERDRSEANQAARDTVRTPDPH